jgi:hypothetical protein
MRFRVGWKQSAENELATIWTNAPERAAVTAAADRIDSLLRKDPLAVGESRKGNLRVLLEPPLAVLYEVDELDLFVDVLKVWRISGPP